MQDRARPVVSSEIGDQSRLRDRQVTTIPKTSLTVHKWKLHLTCFHQSHLRQKLGWSLGYPRYVVTPVIVCVPRARYVFVHCRRCPLCLSTSRILSRVPPNSPQIDGSAETQTAAKGHQGNHPCRTIPIPVSK